MARALIHLPPAPPKRGEVIEIRTLIAHPMESGFRVDAEGHVRQQDLIRRFSCRFNGEPVFSAELFAAIAGNPYLAFHLRADASGTLSFRWEGDNGFAHTEERVLNVA